MTPVTFSIAAGWVDDINKLPERHRTRFAVYHLSHAFDEPEDWGENPRALTAEDWKKMPRGQRIALERALAEPPGNYIPAEQFFAELEAKIKAMAKSAPPPRPRASMTFDLPDDIAPLYNEETEEERNEIANDVFMDAFLAIWQAERDKEIEDDEDERLRQIALSNETSDKGQTNL